MSPAKSPKSLVRWLDDVAAHDYDAAYAYLSLRLSPARAKRLVKRLKDKEPTTRRVNDVLRASSRDPLPLTDPGVHKTLLKVLSGEKLSPVLVVSFVGGADVADGFHRLSLTYNVDPFGVVPLRVVSE